MAGCIFSKSSSSEIEEEIEISNPTKLKIAGVIDLSLVQGNKSSLTMEGEEDAVEAISVKEDSGILKISYEGESNIFNNASTPKITLTLKDLEEITFDGVGNFEMENAFEVDKIKIRGSGVGKIDLNFTAESIDAKFDIMGKVSLQGQTEEMLLRNDGVGKIDAADLVVQNLTLKSNGIGKIDVYCENEMSVFVNGIGSVTYGGDPYLKERNIQGIGKVTAR